MAVASVPRPSSLLPLATDDLLRELIAEVRGLRADVQGRLTTPALSRTDRETLSRLLPAIVGALGSDSFLCRDLLDGDEYPGLRVVTAGLNSKKLGRLFQRAEGIAVDTYVVERDGSELNAVRWRVLVVK